MLLHRLDRMKSAIQPRKRATNDMSNQRSRIRRKNFRIQRHHQALRIMPLTPDTLHEYSLSQPPREHMQQMVRDAYHDQHLSNDLIDAVILSLSGYHVPKDLSPSSKAAGVSQVVAPQHTYNALADKTAAQSNLIMVQHISGVNDFMSGALLTGANKPDVPYDDKLDCAKNIDAQFGHMHWRILTAGALAEIPGLFHDPVACFEILGENFLTTNAGLQRAIEECQQTELDENDRDTMVLGALAKRGGKIPESVTGRKVIYPEDMDPIIGDGCSFHDKLYWRVLYARGKIWSEVLPNI